MKWKLIVMRQLAALTHTHTPTLFVAIHKLWLFLSIFASNALTGRQTDRETNWRCDEPSTIKWSTIKSIEIIKWKYHYVANRRVADDDSPARRQIQSKKKQNKMWIDHSELFVCACSMKDTHTHNTRHFSVRRICFSLYSQHSKTMRNCNWNRCEQKKEKKSNKIPTNWHIRLMLNMTRSSLHQFYTGFHIWLCVCVRCRSSSPFVRCERMWTNISKAKNQSQFMRRSCIW